MKTSHSFYVALACTALPALVLAGCGANSARQLQSITLTPSTATVAGNAGMVQFVATGHFNEAPYTETPFAASWSYTGAGGTKIGLTQDGQASCKAAQTGSFTVAAWVELDPDGPACNVNRSGRRTLSQHFRDRAADVPVT